MLAPRRPALGGCRPFSAKPSVHCAQGKEPPPMADEAQTIRSINWREVFPFTHVFRAFRIAVHPSKLLLALAALLLIYAGGRALDAVWPDKYGARAEEYVSADRADIDYLEQLQVARFEATAARA